MSRAGVVVLPRTLVRNLVAEAVRRDALRRAALDLALSVHLRDDESDAAGLLHDVREMLAVAAALGVADLADALAEVERMQADSNRWRASAAPMLDCALTDASAAIRSASAGDLARATARVVSETQQSAATAGARHRLDNPRKD